MVCPKCAGVGSLYNAHQEVEDYLAHPFLPCQECQGSGIVSCCDTAGANLSTALEEAINLIAYWGDDNEQANEDVARLRGVLNGDTRVRKWKHDNAE